VGWRTYKKGELDFIIRLETGGSVCVNPISWTTSSTATTRNEHKGALGKDMRKPVTGVISAAIEPDHNILWIDLPENAEEKIGTRSKNYHIADYNLFWLDIRENAMGRVKNFINKQNR
jgi:hypothetical protein